MLEPEKLDRRVERTRKLLQASLLALIVEQGFDGLRIEDITERANLRRATFYMHYKDKVELLFSALEVTFATLVEATEHYAADNGLGWKTHYEAYLLTFQHVEQNHVLYKALLNSQSGTQVIRHIHDYLAEMILKGISRSPTFPATVPDEVLAHYIAGTELAMVMWWIEHDRPYPVDQMARMVYTLMLNGIKSLIEHP
jgi:AcrR family transcriptional regulator